MLVSLFRTVILYLVILIGVRLMGKRQISQLQTSELVVTLLISELAVMPIEKRDDPLINGLLPILVLILCELLAAFFMLKSGKFRQLICGKPIVVIENGRILQEQMRRLRMSTEDLLEQLRQNDIFYLREVAYAIIETNGMMSVIRDPAYDFLTPEQMGIQAPFEGLEVVVVSDGEISENSLKLCKKNRDWVLSKISEKGLSLAQVFLMTARMDGTFQIVKKEESKK